MIDEANDLEFVRRELSSAIDLIEVLNNKYQGSYSYTKAYVDEVRERFKLKRNDSASAFLDKHMQPAERCHHPAQDPFLSQPVFVSTYIKKTVFPNSDEMLGSRVVVDPAMTDTRVHFYQPDGTCHKVHV